MGMKNKVAAIGALSLDDIRFHDGSGNTNEFGGSAGYAALGASFFTDVMLISNVGRDYPEEFIANLRSRSIDVTGIRKIPGDYSTRFSIQYDDELKEVEGTKVELNALNCDILLPEAVNEYRYIYIAGNDPEKQLEIIKRLGEGHVVAVATHMHWIRRDPEKVREVFDRSDIVFIDDGELRQLTGKKQMINAGMELFSHGISHLIVKKGEHGAVLFEKDRMYPFIAYDSLDLEYVDPTGCGGVLAGSFLGVLARNGNVREPLDNAFFKALAFGLVVRSFKIEDVSYRRLLKLDRWDIWRRYDRFRDMLTV